MNIDIKCGELRKCKTLTQRTLGSTFAGNETSSLRFFSHSCAIKSLTLIRQNGFRFLAKELYQRLPRDYYIS